MSPLDQLARDVAAALLAGHWLRAEMPARLILVLDVRDHPPWITTVIDRVLARFGETPPTPRQEALSRFLRADITFRRGVAPLVRRAKRRAIATGTVHVPTNLLALPRSEMAPAPAIPGTSTIPSLRTSVELATWLEITPNELEWFADCHARERSAGNEPLRHYRYRWIDKAGGRKRLVESPKPRLCAIQRQILAKILSPIPPHDAAHAFRRGRSTITFSAPHVGRRLVLRIDLRDFFPSIPSARIHALFHVLGYPERVARLLTGLCTNSVPDEVFPSFVDEPRRHRLKLVFGQPHLPQGAPTSPALANLCVYRLDCRLAGLARRAEASYTRYADDLVFSGNRSLERNLDRFRVLVCAILLDEGFEIRHRKTQVMRSGNRQSIAGIVVNQHANFPRDQFDRLKALLHNAWRDGPQSQNDEGHARFREHLLGKIAYVRMIHPVRAAKLQEAFDRIDWSSSDE